MKIQIFELIEGAKHARGLAVIIDVFRAFSLEAYLFSRGVKEIYAVGEQKTAWRLSLEHPEYIKIGERGGKIIAGFDYGNSPSQTENADLMGRTVIHTTSAGTQGLVNASGAEEMVTGSLVNAKAVADYIFQKNPAEVSLVAMGQSGKTSAPEDVLCAKYIQSILNGNEFNMASELVKLRDTESAAKFFVPGTQEIYPAEDYALCTSVDRFDFVLQARKLEGDVFLVTKCKSSDERDT